jgi:branched-chain amino acid transport system ATP-binding protein
VLVIARGLLARPKLLLLDEPSMGLAPQRVEEVFRILREVHDNGVSMLLVEQNARKALAMSDYGYVLQTGSVVLEGTGSSLLATPAVADAYLGRS